MLSDRTKHPCFRAVAFCSTVVEGIDFLMTNYEVYLKTAEIIIRDWRVAPVADHASIAKSARVPAELHQMLSNAPIIETRSIVTGKFDSGRAL